MTVVDLLKIGWGEVCAGGVQPAVVVPVDPLVVGKPDPGCILFAAQRLGVEPEGCVVVEDALAGLAADHVAGMRTVAVSVSNRCSGGGDGCVSSGRLPATRIRALNLTRDA